MTTTRKLFFTYGKFIMAIVGDSGAVHFHYRHNSEMEKAGCGPECGIEFHHKKPVFQSQTPLDGKCWLTKCECYPDGSTLWAQESIYPMFQDCNVDGNFEPLWLHLESIYQERIAADADTENQEAAQ